ncbi:hypothetical protein BH11PSE4_BH11PSE4_21050 [soil metagenome]
MTVLLANDIDHYETYAKHCLTLAAQTPDRASRLLLREMAAEWLKLALPDGNTAGGAPPLNGPALGE